jgi:uncharacterized membrane protein YjfL (UPF0719 family)
MEGLAGFDFSLAILIFQISLFWNVTPYTFVSNLRRFEYLDHIALKGELIGQQ